MYLNTWFALVLVPSQIYLWILFWGTTLFSYYVNTFSHAASGQTQNLRDGLRCGLVVESKLSMCETKRKMWERKKGGRDGERKGGSIKLGEANLAFLQIFCMLVAKRRKCHSHQQHWKSICLLRLKCLARNPYNSYFFFKRKKYERI